MTRLLALAAVAVGVGPDAGGVLLGHAEQESELIVLRPERHTLLTVVAGTVIGMPALTAAWRAVIWPVPAPSTWPMKT